MIKRHLITLWPQGFAGKIIIRHLRYYTSPQYYMYTLLCLFQSTNVTIVDHHSASESFMKHLENEQVRACWSSLTKGKSNRKTFLLAMKMKRSFERDKKGVFLRESFNHSCAGSPGRSVSGRNTVCQPIETVLFSCVILLTQYKLHECTDRFLSFTVYLDFFKAPLPTAHTNITVKFRKAVSWNFHNFINSKKHGSVIETCVFFKLDAPRYLSTKIYGH